MGEEIVSVVVGGQRFTAFLRAQVRASMKEAARSFRLELAAELGATATAWTFRAGAQVSIYANDDLLLVGYVDRYRPRIDATDARVAVEGRSKAADIVDSSAEHETGGFEAKTPVEIANELAAPFGITFAADGDLEPVDYQITPGESVFRAVEKLARQQGYTLMGEADGNVRLPKAGSKRHAGGIIEGHNLKSGEADHNWSNRHSKYVVRGQRATGSGPDSLEVEAIARDAGVGRYRPVIIVEQDDTTPARARKTARNRRDKAAGRALTATVTVQGFRDERGSIWQPGWLVWVESDFLQIRQEMLIETVDFVQDGVGGSETKLGLVDPRSYGGKKNKGNKSGEAWEQSDDEATDE